MNSEAWPNILIAVGLGDIFREDIKNEEIQDPRCSIALPSEGG